MPALTSRFFALAATAPASDEAYMPEPYVKIQHPEWYARDWQGDPYPPPWTDWSDVVTLDYEQPGLRRYMTYAWGFYNTLHTIARGKADVGALVGHYCEKNNSWPRDGMRMVFVSNHDKNAWDDTEFGAFGEALHNAIVLSFVSEGMPLNYNGQEAGTPSARPSSRKTPATTHAGAPAAVPANDKDKVFAVFNFSGEDQQVSFSSAVYEGRYRDFVQ